MTKQMFWLPSDPWDSPRVCRLSWTRLAREGSPDERLGARAGDGAPGVSSRRSSARRKGENADTRDVERESIDNATWHCRGGSHYLRFSESASGSRTSADASSRAPADDVRTTLRVEEKAVTWLRHGLVRWNHTFRVGETCVSRMDIAGQGLGIQTQTERVDIDIRPTGGHLALVYWMTMLDDPDAAPSRIEVTFEWVEQGAASVTAHESLRKE